MQPINLVKFVVREEKTVLNHSPLSDITWPIAINQSNEVMYILSVVKVSPFQFCALSPAER